jgi:hypothetical protein
MSWAVADMYRELDVHPFLEDALEDYLENYIPRQEPGMQMNL